MRQRVAQTDAKILGAAGMSLFVSSARRSSSATAEIAEARDMLLRPAGREAERSFYADYAWCLNPCPTVGDALAYLEAELARVDQVEEDWQRGEVETNVFLLAAAVLNAADDYLHGPVYKLPGPAKYLPFSRAILGTIRIIVGFPRKLPSARVRAWRERWLAAFDLFLQHFLGGMQSRLGSGGGFRDGLAALARASLPTAFRRLLLKIPTAFRGQDLTHHDVVELGKKFSAAFPERAQRLTVLGLRTSGSYFAPLLRALLSADGYRQVGSLTVRPDQGLSAFERQSLGVIAKRGDRVVLVDDPPGTGDTIALAVDMLHRAGVSPTKIVALLPIHPTCRDWANNQQALSLARLCIMTLEPEEWHKQAFLDGAGVEARLQDYYRGQGYVGVDVLATAAAAPQAIDLQRHSEESRRTRLKRVFAVRLSTVDGHEETRHVLAKSVGWGWLGYHAFLAGDRLAAHVPPVLGLRDGILYTEWIPQRRVDADDRPSSIEDAASYIAARVRALPLDKGAAARLTRDKQHRANDLLARMLAKAYGWNTAAILKRGRIRQRLDSLPCPCPTLIDGRMRRTEWVHGPASFLKTDFEHHGLGKNELNVVDPAFDVAETILALDLSLAEENTLVARYREESGDATVVDRLFLHKLLAGTVAMATARTNLRHPQLVDRYDDFNRDFVKAWNFLTIQAARLCGGFCRRPESVRWGPSVAVLDVDGVLDRRIFGFPTTTAAGVQALSLLHAHDRAIAINSARSVLEIREYCKAYGLAGGVAEYGSYVWDATVGKGRCLVGPEALEQLELLRRELRRLPGAFVNDTYEYSIRAYTFEEGGPVPLPTLTIQALLARLRLDRLAFHQTSIDSAIVAKESDKGRGLEALLDLVGMVGADTVAVGDSEPDLAMFRAARRSFAPAQMCCGRLARLHGCKIVRRAHQAGLLEIAHAIVHPSGGRCRRCSLGPAWPRGKNIFLDLLAVADSRKPYSLLKALFDPRALQVFVE